MVDLAGDAVVSWTHVPGVCPNFTVDEWHDCDDAMHEHAEVVAALAARGITDLDLVLIDVWTYGKALMPEQYARPAARLVRRLGAGDARAATRTPTRCPGLKFIVDMNTIELLEIEDDHDIGLPAVMGEYDPDLVAGLDAAHRPQAAGDHPAGGAVASASTGNVLRWQNWAMRLGFNYREGPVIYQVTYDDHGTSATSPTGCRSPR